MPNDLNHKPIDRIEYATATMPKENRAKALIDSIANHVRKTPVDLIVKSESGKHQRKLHPNSTLFIANMIKQGKAKLFDHEFTQLSSLDLPTAEDLAPIKVPADRMALRYAFLR